MRLLSKNLFNALKEGDLKGLLEYVKNDDTLDMEFRGNYFTIYYRGGKLLSVAEMDSEKYDYRPLDVQYHEGIELKNAPKDYDSYIPEAKHLIDYYICTAKKNHLGEKEIQQLVVKENNYSPNSNDTDYFIVDMEYEESEKIEDGRFDLIALRWDSTGPERRSKKVSLAVIEVKQGIDSVQTRSKYDGKILVNPGLKKHQQDFVAFLQKKKKGKSLTDFYEDMKMIFLQKCALGLIRANIQGLIKGKEYENITYEDLNGDQLQLKSSYIDFICLLANYKYSSRNLEIELVGMDDCKFISSAYMGYGLYTKNIFTLASKYPNMKDTYKEGERKNQEAVFNRERNKGKDGIFETSLNGWYMGSSNANKDSDEKRKKYKCIIKPEYSKNNLYSDIRQNAIDYFKDNDISWWHQEEDGYFPTGHLLSSQIHCLNHLFDIRTDEDAVKLIAEKATGMQFDEILPSLVDVKENGDKDEKSYITFEFALDNDKMLGENDKGWKRGTLCTSIDVMIMARKGEKTWLIPIEWKYTEAYKRVDKTNKKRKARYSKLIKTSKRLRMPEDGIPHSVYFIEPNYELMRQALLCEQLVANSYADDFFHINVIPNGNTELRNAVENEYIPMLKDKTKFKIIDPQDLLSPLEENNLHPELIEYLKKRYWYR